MKYSFVIPCYNSEKTINGVIDEINLIMKNNSFEIILVNDFSSDNTLGIINNLAANFENITAISFAKNFGQHAALIAGYRQVTGDIIISLDDDGQTPANEVFNLINKLNEGYDVVYAKYSQKKHSFFRNIGSKVNDYMAVKLINKPKDLYVSSYFVANKFIIDEIIKYNNPFPYIGGLILRTTSSICNISVNHRDREYGKSGYSFSKLLKLWLNGFTAFSVKPLRVSVYFGILASMFGVVLFVYAIVNKIFNTDVPMGWTSMIATLSLLGGTILAVLGMIGEYIGRIYISLNNSPQYVIKEKVVKENEK